MKNTHKLHSKISKLQPYSLSELEQICGGGVDPDTDPPPCEPGQREK